MPINLDSKYTVVHALEDRMGTNTSGMTTLLRDMFDAYVRGAVNPSDMSMTQYTNGNGFASVAVSVVSRGSDNRVRSWSAYRGGAPAYLPMEWAAVWVSRYGSKMSKREATKAFSDHDIVPYNE